MGEQMCKLLINTESYTYGYKTDLVFGNKSVSLMSLFSGNKDGSLFYDAVGTFSGCETWLYKGYSAMKMIEIVANYLGVTEDDILELVRSEKYNNCSLDVYYE